MGELIVIPSNSFYAYLNMFTSIESDPMKNKDAHDEWGLPTH